MPTDRQMLTAHDIDRMYKQVEAKHPKAMKHIRYIENFKKKINATK